MTHQDFVKWLEGYLDGKGDKLDKKDITVIREKMASCSEQISIPNMDKVSPFQPTTDPVIVPYVDPFVKPSPQPYWEITCNDNGGWNVSYPRT